MPDTLARRRYRLIEAVLDGVRHSGPPVVPVAFRDEVDAEFGGVDGLLLAVAHRWHTAFVAHLDAVLEDAPADLSAAVAELWQALARTHATSRALLDAHAARPTLVAAHNRLRRDVLAATGVELPACPPSGHPALPRHRPTTGAVARVGHRYGATSGSANPIGYRKRATLRWACRLRPRTRAATGPARPEGGLR